MNKTEVIETSTGTLKRFCKASGWGNYDGSLASSKDASVCSRDRV